MFTIHLAFYNRYNLDFDNIDRPFGSGDYLLLHFVTPMKLKLNDSIIVTKENAFIIFDKGTPQQYSAVKTFQNSFIHFDCDYDFAAKYNLPLNTVFYPSDLDETTRLFKSIHLEFFLKRTFCAEANDSYMTQLMIALSRLYSGDTVKTEKTSYLFNVFQGARLEILSDITRPWTSKSMAALTNLGTSQFYQYYLTYFGSTPKSDLINARLAHAKELLVNGQASVSEAALKSGFQTPAHFSRYFKKEYGKAPLEWVNDYFLQLH